MKPRPGQRRGHPRRGVEIVRRQRLDLLGVPLLDHPEPAKLALDAIEVAMVIRVSAHEPVPADPVGRLDAFDDQHRERQSGAPWPSSRTILQVEARRWDVAHSGECAHAVADRREQVRLLRPGQSNTTQRVVGVARQRRRPDQAGGAVAVQVSRGDPHRVVDGQTRRAGDRFGPRVSRPVEVEPDARTVQIDQVRGSAAVDVGKAQSIWLVLVRRVKTRRCIHRDLCAEAAIPEIRPVHDLTVADPDEIAETVAGHVREEDRLRLVGEGEPRSGALVKRHAATFFGSEPVSTQRRLPDQNVVTDDEHVRMAVAVEIDEAYGRVAQ